MCRGILLYIWLHTIHIPGSYRGHKNVLDPLEIGVTDCCEQPCWCWDSNSDPLEEGLPVVLTAEPCLQPHWYSSLSRHSAKKPPGPTLQ